MRKIIDFFFGIRPLKLKPDELAISMEYVNRVGTKGVFVPTGLIKGQLVCNEEGRPIVTPRRIFYLPGKIV